MATIEIDSKTTTISDIFIKISRRLGYQINGIEIFRNQPYGMAASFTETPSGKNFLTITDHDSKELFWTYVHDNLGCSIIQCTKILYF